MALQQEKQDDHLVISSTNNTSSDSRIEASSSLRGNKQNQTAPLLMEEEQQQPDSGTNVDPKEQTKAVKDDQELTSPTAPETPPPPPTSPSDMLADDQQQLVESASTTTTSTDSSENEEPTGTVDGANDPPPPPIQPASPFRGINALRADAADDSKTSTTSMEANNNDNSTTSIIEDCKEWNERLKHRSRTSEEAFRRRKSFHDSKCGSLWTGRSTHPGSATPPKRTRIHMVIAHCMHNPSSWLDKVLKLFQNEYGYIVSVQFYSKCGKADEQLDQTVLSKAKGGVDIDTSLPNVGGCDHTYAYWMTQHHPQQREQQKDDATTPSVDASSKENIDNWDYVLFVKDTFHEKAQLLLAALQKTVVTTDFGCVKDHPAPIMMYDKFQMRLAYSLDPTVNAHAPPTVMRAYGDFSTLHSTSHLSQFKIRSYSRAFGDDEEEEAEVEETGDTSGTEKQRLQQEIDNLQFESNYANLGSFVKKELGIEDGWLSSTTPLVRVCFGGNFVVTRRGLEHSPLDVFVKAEQALRRGNNIEEGHFLERLWASFFQPPLTTEQVEAIRDHFMGGVVMGRTGLDGMLGRVI